MGTRGITGIYASGKRFYQYNHNDSNPEDLGIAILRECKAASLQAFADAVKRLVLVEDDEKPTAAQRKEVFPFIEGVWPSFEKFEVELKKGHPDARTWRAVLEPTRGTFEPWLAGLNYVVDYDTFQFSHSCEWAYIVNVDTGCLEIYTGNWRNGPQPYYHPKRKPRGRYAQGQGDPDGDGWGILLLDELPFDELVLLPDEALSRYCKRLDRLNS